MTVTGPYPERHSLHPVEMDEIIAFAVRRPQRLRELADQVAIVALFWWNAVGRVVWATMGALVAYGGIRRWSCRLWTQLRRSRRGRS